MTESNGGDRRCSSSARSLDRYESLRTNQQPPSLDRLKSSIGGLSCEQIAEFIHIDQVERFDRGLLEPAEQYFVHFPQLRTHLEHALDVVYHEYLLRQESGAPCALEEFESRFPDLAERLRIQLRIRKLVAADSIGVGGTSPAETERDARESETPSRPSPNEIWDGRYEILSEVGRGGVGIVYKAQDLVLNRTVAIKMLLTGPRAAQEQISRFRVEAEAAARLRHPGIVQVFEWRESAGVPYMVLEYVDGGSLAARRTGQPVEPKKGARFVALVARAVHHAHERGILHRDLKPGNILLERGPFEAPPASEHDWNGVIPKVVDFGLAKRLDLSAEDLTSIDVTNTGDLLGTPGYLAPEQVSGSTSHLGPACDVHALGVILFELLVGRAPYQGATILESLQLVSKEDASFPPGAAKAIPLDLRTITLKCLEKDPRRRYASALALALDLERFADGVPVLARPIGLIERSRRWCLRYPSQTILASCIAVLLIAFSIGSFLSARHMRQLAEERALEANQRLYEARIAEAQTSRIRAQLGWRQASLDALSQASDVGDSKRLIDETIACLAPPELSVGPSCGHWTADSHHADLDSRFERLAQTHRDGTCVVTSTKEGREIARIPGQKRETWPILSGDGNYVAVRSIWSQLSIWRLTANEPVRIGEWSDVAEQSFCFSADSKHVAIGNQTSDVVICSLEPFAIRSSFHVDRQLSHLAFRPDGSEIAVATNEGVQIHGAGRGELRHRFPHAHAVTWVAWSPDGSAIAGADSQLNVPLWNRLRHTPFTLLTGPSSGGVTLAFHPKGQYLAAFDWDHTLRVWDWRSERLVLQTTNAMPCLRFREDGGALAAHIAGDRLQLLNLSESPVLRSPTVIGDDPDSNYLQALTCPWIPDSQLVAFATNEGIAFWDERTNRVLARLRSPSSVVMGVDHQGHLWTSGAMGIRRWPVQVNSDSGTKVSIGPPEEVGWNGQAPLFRPSISPDGKYMAFAGGGSAILIRTMHPFDSLIRAQDTGVGSVDFGNGWIATGGRLERDVRISRTDNGEVLTRLKALDDGTATGVFAIVSPKGNWVLTVGTRNRLWRSSDWSLQHEFPPESTGPAAFAPSEDYLAIRSGHDTIAIVDLQTNREALRLESPYRERIKWMGFDSSGSKLYFLTGESRTMHYWDLHAVVSESQRLHIGEETTAVLKTPTPVDSSPEPDISLQIRYSQPWLQLLIPRILTNR